VTPQRSPRAKQPRAASPQLPASSPALLRDQAEFRTYQREREKAERRSVVRGLLLMSASVLAASIVRAGLDRVFVHGWWRP